MSDARQPTDVEVRALARRSKSDPQLMSFVNRLLDIHYKQVANVAKLAVEEAGLARELGWPAISTYVVEGGKSRLVKIGRSQDVPARIRTLQASSPATLKVLRVIPFDCERAMHHRYAHLRRHGEWFEFDLDMLTDTFSEELLTEARALIAEAA